MKNYLPVTLALVCALVPARVFAQSVCCDFDFTCSWENSSSWKPSKTFGLPDLVYYPNFEATQPSSTYEYLQNQSGDLTGETSIYIPPSGTYLSFDYFFDSPSGNTFDYFYVNFLNKNNGYATQIAYIFTQSSVWETFSIYCGATNNYCCGTSNGCYGVLEVWGYFDTSDSIGLLAIDNIGTCNEYVPTPPSTTLPPPPPGSCCDVESSTCSFTLNDWFWSAQVAPSGTVPSHDGQFFWTNYYNSELASLVQDNVYSSTTFSMDYFISSSSVYFNVFFQLDSGVRNYLNQLTYTNGGWQSSSVSCGNCCFGSSSPCEGQVVIVVAGSGSSFNAAVDNLSRDGACR